MQHVYIVFGMYNDTEAQDTLGVYTTFEAAEARAKSAQSDKSNDGYDRYANAYVYKVELNTDIVLW